MSRGPWILTATGRQVYPLAMDEYDVDIDDIAHSLSRIGRFGGHAARFYSVAEHSIHVMTAIEMTRSASDTVLALAALLHDAAECYLGDLATPIKRETLIRRPDGEVRRFEQVEDRILDVVEHSFSLTIGSTRSPIVKEFDRRALATERRDLMQHGGPDWPSLEGIEPFPRRIPMPPAWARDCAVIQEIFLQHFHRLHDRRQREMSR